MVGQQVPWPRPRRSRGQAGPSYFFMELYILKSENFDRYYVGISANAQKRITEHNLGKTKSTKAHRPWKLIYTEQYPDYRLAREREKYLKSYSGAGEKKKIIDKYSEIV
ncbi:MAG: GIY-YIG nuclease family protein [Candidatus Shapirobacteria bacterium]|nr:GIY-YIG nuclease family protein [Candidatus Shapirobacteria bacterium]